MMNGPSEHLSWNELACKDGTLYPKVWRKSRAIALANVFEIIREVCGNKPIKVVSAYRTPEYNRKIGGARNSQHMEGRALDLKPPVGMTVGKFYDIIKNIASVTLIRGIGRYITFVHVDIRPTDHIAYWSATNVKDNI